MKKVFLQKAPIFKTLSARSPSLPVRATLGQNPRSGPDFTLKFLCYNWPFPSAGIISCFCFDEMDVFPTFSKAAICAVSRFTCFFSPIDFGRIPFAIQRGYCFLTKRLRHTQNSRPNIGRVSVPIVKFILSPVGVCTQNISTGVQPLRL